MKLPERLLEDQSSSPAISVKRYSLTFTPLTAPCEPLTVAATCPRIVVSDR